MNTNTWVNVMDLVYMYTPIDQNIEINKFIRQWDI